MPSVTQVSMPSALTAAIMSATRSRSLSFGPRQAAPMQKRVAPLSLAALAAADDRLDIQQRLALGLAVMRRLRAVAAVLGTAAGLDRQQGRQLDGIGGVILPMHFLGAEQQLVEGQFEQADDGVGGPAQLRNGGGRSGVAGRP
jgi:hypothetical protein